MKSLGKRAKERREHIGLTQSQVAFACGVTQQAYEKLESGDVFRPRYITELADVLQTTAKWLLTGRGNSTLAGALSPPSQLAGIVVYSYLSNSPTSQTIAWDRDTPIDRITSFPGLDHTPLAAGLFIQGNGLEPCYRHGYTIFINRGKHPAKDGSCVYEDENSTYVCNYLGHDDENYYFSSFTKEKSKIPRVKIKGVYMIVGVLYA